MPIHDWTRVSAGTFHAFHLSWISEIQLSLNSRVLPADYYAQAEQIVGAWGPDVLTLQMPESGVEGMPDGESSRGGIAVASTPRSRFSAEAEMNDSVLKRRTLVIRHNSNDRIIALIEIVSPGNKESRHAMRSFIDKAVEALYRGYHLLVVDLLPPGPRDPQGIHGVIWGEISNIPFVLPEDDPLTLVAYSAGPIKRAYIEPTAEGKSLIDMPLFLEPELYVGVPLEETYQLAYQGVPRRWRTLLESPREGGTP